MSEAGNDSRTGDEGVGSTTAAETAAATRQARVVGNSSRQGTAKVLFSRSSSRAGRNGDQYVQVPLNPVTELSSSFVRRELSSSAKHSPFAE